MTAISTGFSRDGAARFLKFAAVGVANTAVTFAVLHLLTVLMDAPALAANAVGWVAGFANSFLWNRVWTFADRRSLPALRVLPRFALSTALTLAVSSAVIAALQALVPAAARGGLVLDAVEAAAICASLAVSYSLSTRWAFH